MPFFIEPPRETLSAARPPLKYLRIPYAYPFVIEEKSVVISLPVWIAFLALILFLLALDLGVFNRKAHVIEFKEAMWWTIIWIVVALVFNVWVYWYMGTRAGHEFLTGYIIERVLSIDNIFVFLLVFSYFQVPDKYQHRVLFWGILGALVMRGLFIAAGITLIHLFAWVMYIFGLFLVITGIKMAMEKGKKIHPEKNPVLRFCRRLFPVTDNYVEGKFLVIRNGKYWITPLFLVLVFVEATDVVFALDSIPAILAITLDPFIVFTSNVFAILGLRAMYFAVADILRLFHYLHYGLSFILVFVGVKMLIEDIYHIPVLVSLGVISILFLVSIVASIIWPQEEELLPAGGKIQQ